MVMRLISRAVCEAVGTMFDWIPARFPTNTVRAESTNACNARCVASVHTRDMTPGAVD